MKRWKVLLVDDEAYILEMLRDMIPWEFYGFELAGTAGNAREAMKAYYEKRPDLIITDICMEGVSGIEFITKLRLQDAGVKVLILSAYDRFEYAQRALKLNVDGYLLKPVVREELVSQLLEIHRSLEEEPDYRGQLRCLKESLDELEQEYSRSQLLGLYRGTQRAAAGKLAEEERVWLVMSIQTIVRDEIVFIERDLKEILQVQTDVLFADDGVFAVFCRAAGEERLGAAVMLVRRKYCEGEPSVLCGISGTAKGSGQLPRLCRESREALNQLFYEEGRFFWKYRERAGSAGGTAEPDREQMGLWLINGELARCRAAVREWMEACRRDGRERAQVLEVCQSLMGLAAKFAVDEEGKGELEEIGRQLGRALRCREAEQLLARCMEWADERELKAKKMRKLIANAQDYMKEHCFEETFSVDALTEYLGISKSYLSRLYKEENGDSIWNDVIRLRMAKARELLVGSDATGYAIAKAIGYSSEYHFSRAFTKAVGVSPTKYKRLWNGGDCG